MQTLLPQPTRLAETLGNLHTIADYLHAKMGSSKTKLLWGTANYVLASALHGRRVDQS